MKIDKDDIRNIALYALMAVMLTTIWMFFGLMHMIFELKLTRHF